MNRRMAVALGATGAIVLSATMWAAMAAEPSRDLDERLEAFGVPLGSELVAAQADGDGSLVTAIYRDASGETHTVGGVSRPATPRPDR